MNLTNMSPGFGSSTPAYLSTKEAARFLGISHRTLEDWRLRGGGPVFRKLGGAVRYALVDLIAFADARIVRNTAEALAA